MWPRKAQELDCRPIASHFDVDLHVNITNNMVAFEYGGGHLAPSYPGELVSRMLCIMRARQRRPQDLFAPPCFSLAGKTPRNLIVRVTDWTDGGLTAIAQILWQHSHRNLNETSK